MLFDQGPTIIDQFFQLLQQIILPNWSDLILLVPWTLFVLIVLSLLYLLVLYRRAAAVNKPRIAPRLPGMPPPGTHLPGPSPWPFIVPIGAAIILFAFVAPHEKSGPPFNPIILVLGLIVTLVGISGWLLESMREWRRTAAVEHGAVNLAVAVRPALSAERAMVLAPPAAVAPAYEESALKPP